MERGKAATMEATSVDQNRSKKRKKNRSSSPSPPPTLLLTRSRSRVFLHVTRSGHVRPDVHNKRTIHLQSHALKPRFPKDHEDPTLPFSHPSSSSEEDLIRNPSPILSTIIKDLRARRVFSPSTSIAADASAGSEEEEEEGEDRCYSRDDKLLETMITSSNNLEINESDGLGFDAVDLELGDGDDPHRVGCFDEKYKLLLQPLEVGDMQGEKKDCSSEGVCDMDGEKKDCSTDGVSDIQKPYPLPKVDDQLDKHTPPPDALKEEVPVIAHNRWECRSENVQNRSVNQKPGVTPVSRLKIFHTRNSLSYRRLLPFLMGLTKENSSTLEAPPSRNLLLEVGNGIGHGRPPKDCIKDGEGDITATPLHLDGLENPETERSRDECSTCPSIESLKLPIVIKEHPENPKPSQFPAAHSSPSNCVTVNHTFSVNELPTCYNGGNATQIVYPEPSESCRMSPLPKKCAGSSNSVNEIAAHSSPPHPSINSDVFPLNGCVAAHPFLSSNIIAQDVSPTSPMSKTSTDVTELRPPEVVDILPSSSLIPFKDQHSPPPVSSHPDPKVESPVPSSIDLLLTDYPLPLVKIPVVSEKPNLAPTKGILKTHLRECKGLCMCSECTSFRLHAEEAYEFSRKQMQDAEQMAVGLMKELSCLQSMMEKSISPVSDGNGCHAIIQHGQLKRFCKRAARAEGVAIERLRQMRRDLNIRCRISLMQRPQQRPPTPRLVKFSDDVEEKFIPKEEDDP